MYDIFEAAGRRAKRTKTLTPWVFSIEKVLLTVKCSISVWVIRCISDFRRPCTCCILETGNRRAKQTKIWASGVSI